MASIETNRHHEINQNNLSQIEIELPPYKKNRIEETHPLHTGSSGEDLDSIDHLFYELNEQPKEDTSLSIPHNEISETTPSSAGIQIPANPSGSNLLDEEINQALLSFNKFNGDDQIDFLIDSSHSNKNDSSNVLNLPSLSSSSSENCSPFDSPDTLTSITTHEEEFKSVKRTDPMPSVNAETVFSIKQAMINTSKLTSLFTTLKVTYLKLCKEFNYLLSKFNENERVKIGLIHENNELKKLLAEVIKEKENDRREFKEQLMNEKKKLRACHLEHSKIKRQPEEIIKVVDEKKEPEAPKGVVETPQSKTTESIEDQRTRRRKRRAVGL